MSRSAPVARRWTAPASPQRAQLVREAATAIAEGLDMLAMELLGRAANEGAVGRLPDLALGRRAGGLVEAKEVPQQEEVRALEDGGERRRRDGAIRCESRHWHAGGRLAEQPVESRGRGGLLQRPDSRQVEGERAEPPVRN